VVDTCSLPGVVDRRIRLGVLDSKPQGVEGRILEPLGSPEQLGSIELVDSTGKVGKKSWSTEVSAHSNTTFHIWNTPAWTKTNKPCPRLMQVFVLFGAKDCL
jgi:hypothetical protein